MTLAFKFAVEPLSVIAILTSRAKFLCLRKFDLEKTVTLYLLLSNMFSGF